MAGCNTQDDDPATTHAPTTGTSTTTPSATDSTTDTQTETETSGSWQVDPLEHDKLVGAHYYPWYNSDSYWSDWLWMTPVEPVLGNYHSANEAVINQHIK